MPATMISSPYDTDARYSTKRDSTWVGYKVHVTETCDVDAPHVIVNVETTAATTPDDNMLAVIHKSLESRDLLPADDHVLELTHSERKRIFNLGYYTWVEQQGVSVEEFDRRKDQAFWRSLVETVPVWDRMIQEMNEEVGARG